MTERIKCQEGIMPNLLSGFYEQVASDLKDESLRCIFQSLRKSIENDYILSSDIDNLLDNCKMLNTCVLSQKIQKLIKKE